MADAPKIIVDDWKKRDDEPTRPTSPAAGTQPSGVTVDSDWKSQAQAEKERLAATEKKEPGEARGAAGQRAMPPADWQTLVGSMVSQALLYLGAFPDPETGRAIVSLEHARFNIDLLSVLQEKTKGNLTAEDADELQKAIHELRLRYVDIAQAVAEMAAKRGAAGGGPAGTVITPGGAGAMPPLGPGKK